MALRDLWARMQPIDKAMQKALPWEAELPDHQGMADVRWEQRLTSYSDALSQLAGDIKVAGARSLSEMESRGLVKSFEFTYELAWNVVRDYFEHQRMGPVIGPRDAFLEAFRVGLVSDGESWMEMIVSRNQTNQTYNRATAQTIVTKTVTVYFPLFEAFRLKMQSLKGP